MMDTCVVFGLTQTFNCICYASVAGLRKLLRPCMTHCITGADRQSTSNTRTWNWRMLLLCPQPLPKHPVKPACLARPSQTIVNTDQSQLMSAGRLLSALLQSLARFLTVFVALHPQ